MRGTTLRLKKVLLIVKLVSYLTICSIYILISLRPEGQHPKQFRLLIVKQTKLQSFQWAKKLAKNLKN